MMRFILFASSALTAAGVIAQVSIGYRAGISVASIRDNYTEDGPDRERVIGIATAIPVEIRLGERFALQPELSYTQKGYGAYPYFSYSYYMYVGTLSRRMHYLELHALAKMTLGQGKVRTHLLLGPSIGRGMLIVDRFDSGDDGSYVAADDFGPGKNDFRPLEMSAVAGAGLTFGKKRTRFFFDLRYAHGLTPLRNEDVEQYVGSGQYETLGNYFSQTLLVQVGYLITLGETTTTPPPVAP